MKTFSLKVLASDGVFYDGRCKMVILPAVDGELGILANHATNRQSFLKRMLDIAGGLVGSILTIILTVIIGPLIYIQSPGPIFFSQERIGKNGKRFKMYKFRSMYMDAEERKKDLMEYNDVKDGMMFKIKDE